MVRTLCIKAALFADIHNILAFLKRKSPFICRRFSVLSLHFSGRGCSLFFGVSTVKDHPSLACVSSLLGELLFYYLFFLLLFLFLFFSSVLLFLFLFFSVLLLLYSTADTHRQSTDLQNITTQILFICKAGNNIHLIFYRRNFPLGDVFSTCLVIFPATLWPFLSEWVTLLAFSKTRPRPTGWKRQSKT